MLADHNFHERFADLGSTICNCTAKKPTCLDSVVFLGHHSCAECANLDSQPPVHRDQENTECHSC